MGDHHDYLRQFVDSVQAGAMLYDGDPSESIFPSVEIHDLPPAMIHEVDQRTADLRNALHERGIELSDSKVAAAFAFVCTSVAASIAESFKEHAKQCGHPNCEVGFVLAYANIQDFVGLLGLAVKESVRLGSQSDS